MPQTESELGARAPDGAPRETRAAGRSDVAQPLARLALARRRRRDAAAALPIVAIVLFCSPILDLFAGAGRLMQIPVGVLFVFGAWFVLIWITARLSRRLIEDAGDG